MKKFVLDLSFYPVTTAELCTLSGLWFILHRMVLTVSASLGCCVQ